MDAKFLVIELNVPKLLSMEFVLNNDLDIYIPAIYADVKKRRHRLSQYEKRFSDRQVETQ